MEQIKLFNGSSLSNLRERIREYVRVEIYQGYDDQHSVDNEITQRDIRVANKLFARIGDNVAQKIVNNNFLRTKLAVVEDKELSSVNGWDIKRRNISLLLSEFCNIAGVGLAVATKILHLKRPHLLPILDSFVIELLYGIKIQDIYDKSKLCSIGMQAIDDIRKDLQNNSAAFTLLQSKLTDLPIPLTTVRLYDILIWSTEKWDNRGILKAPYGVPQSNNKNTADSLKPKQTTGGEIMGTLNASFWMNVDKPLKKCTIHCENGCSWVIKKAGTPFKGKGCIKRDGGWLPFESLTEAQNYARSEYPNYAVVNHCA